jgi:DNA polymerase-4
MGIIETSWGGSPIRLITVTAINLLDDDDVEQLSFLGMDGGADGPLPEAGASGRARGERLDKTMDSIREKYGAGAIVFGSILHNDIGVATEEREGDE